MKLPIAAIALALFASSVFGQGHSPRGLDFRAYLSLQRGMTEGEVLAIAGVPDVVSDQGFAPKGTLVLFDKTYPPAPCGELCAMKAYIYLPTGEVPYTTTVTLVSGRITEIERKQKF
jgi:hypothetical protein